MARTKKIAPDHKQVEIALRESEIKFRTLTEMAASAIFIYRGTKFLYVNPATEILTGYSRKELMGKNIYDLFPMTFKKSLRTSGAHLLRGELQSTRDEFRLIPKEGDERWIDLTSGTIKFDGKPAIIGTAFDITERKRAELLQDAVYRIVRATDRSKRLDDLFPAVHAIIAEVMNAGNFYIALYDENRDLITFPYYVDEYDLPSEASKPGKGLTEYVIHTGKSLLCDHDTHRKLERKGEIKLIGTPSPIWLGVPLKIDDRVIGVMVVQHYKDSNAYGAREQQILEFVSSQVAMAINRKRAEMVLNENEVHLKRRADVMSALFETTRELTTQRDIAILLQTIIDRAASILDSPGGSILLYNRDRDELELLVAHGSIDIVGTRLRMGEGISGKVAQSLQPMVINDYRNWEARSEKFDSLRITAIIAVPMLYSGELVGVITLYESGDSSTAILRKFSQSDVDLLSFFAGAAASAVHNARLFGETRQRLVELEMLYQASLAAAQIHSLQAVAQRIVDALATQFGWSSSIWVIDTDRQRPILSALNNNKGSIGESLKNEIDRINALHPSFDQGIVGWVCKNSRPMRTGDTASNPYYIQSYPETLSELCVPLKIGGSTIGCVNVESEKPDAFNEHDERLLTTISNQAAVAIENARLFEETRRRAVRQAALNTIITAATRAGTDIDTILNTVLEQTLKALNLDMGTVWLMWSHRSVQRVAAKGIPPSISFMMANAAITGGLSLSRNLVVDDWSRVKHQFSDTFISLGIHSAIIVPLASEGKRIGGLAIASSQLHQWTAEETALVEAIGREVGAAAERAKLFEETQARLAELETINKVSIALRLAKSINEMLPQLIDETLKSLDAEAGSIWFYEPDREKLFQAVGRGWCTNISHLDLERGDGVPGAVFAIGDIYFSSDVSQDSLTPAYMHEYIPAGWSAVCAPIRSENETIGSFLVSTRLPREFDGEDARLLVTLTEMAGNAIHRMRLNEQTEHHATELEGRVAERTAELQEALKKAQEADRLKSEFIANVNHELRTPLTNLVLYYQMLRAQPTVKTEERLDVIGRELQRLRSLIEDLLNLSRLDLGQVTFYPLPHDLNNLIQTLVDDRRSLAEERGLTLMTELQPGLAPILLDEPTMVQAVSNLLTNALNYTPSGGKVWVRTMTSDQDGEPWAGFCVQDTGLGINEEEVPHLFERFYRGRAGHESGAPGTGLGLAIVKQVVEHHHGRIEVRQGEDGHGAVFTIWLPVKNQQETI